MFERFDDDARRVVVLAQEDARLLLHNYIGTEHLLLGLARVDHGVVFDAFRFHELTVAGLLARVEDVIGRGGTAPSGHIPFTPRAKEVLELSLREAVALGDETVGAEHILLGVLTEGTGVATRVLEASGVELGALRAKVLELRGGDPSGPRVVTVPGRAIGGTGMAVMGTFSGARPVPRCALCGREEPRCERVLVAGGFRLCSDCARAAVVQLDALPDDAPTLVRYQRPERAPRDKYAAVAAIERAFDTVLGPMQRPIDEALDYAEGGEQLRGLLERLREGAAHAPMVLSDQTVERVRFLDEESAEVSLGLWFPGNPQPTLFPVHAVREGGTWKVSRSTVEHFAGLVQQFRRPPGL